MANSRTRFSVRVSTQFDPDWEVDKSIDLWERMLASRLWALVGKPPQTQQEGASE